MKWIFFVLLTINIVLISMQWLESRSLKQEEQYSADIKGLELKLLSERGNRGALLAQRSDMCLLIGPLESKALANEMLSSLGEVGNEASLVEQSVEKAPGYWVYFDAFEGKDAAVWLKEFKRKKIDSYVIGSGELNGSLSLGVFDNIDLAYRLKKMMKKKGYEVKINEISKADNEFWLLFSSSYAAENTKKIDEMLTPLKKMHEKREIFCKSVASEK